MSRIRQKTTREANAPNSDWFASHLSHRLCPLFDAERAIRDVLGENLHPGALLSIEINRAIQARPRGEDPSDLEPDVEVPDFLPEEWGAEEQPKG